MSFDERPKWKITLFTNGEVKIEGDGFNGDECINDIFYKLLQKIAAVKEEKRTIDYDERPVQNLHYIQY